MTIKKEYLINTKWDTSDWSDDQKIKWIDEMESLGFCVDQVKDLDENFYFLEDDYTIDLCVYASTYESWHYEERFYEDIFPTKVRESANLEKTKEDFINTRWDVSDWTDVQKTKWQQYMFDLGFGWWDSGKKVKALDADYYFVSWEDLSYSDCHETYEDEEFFTLRECKYEDVFPNEDTTENGVVFDKTKEDFINTRWDVSGWSDDQKVKWQQYMFGLGFSWVSSGRNVVHSDVGYYFLGSDMYITFSVDHDVYEEESELKECLYKDVFPDTNEGVLSVKSEETAYYSNLDKESFLKDKSNFFKDLMDMIDYTTKMNVNLFVSEDQISVYSRGLGLEVKVSSQEELDQVLEAIKILEQKMI